MTREPIDALEKAVTRATCERERKELIVSTIERCARVVRKFGQNADGGWTHRILMDCYDAIRALRDKP